MTTSASSIGHSFSCYTGSDFGRHPLAPPSSNHSNRSSNEPIECHTYLNKQTPRRYFNLGLFCCCLAGFVFIVGLFLMVWGSSPFEPEAIWITGLFFMFLGGFLFFLGIGSIGLYLAREDNRKHEIEQIKNHHYAASIASGRSLKSQAHIYLID